MLKEGIADRVRVLDISEKKARIWNLQKQRRQAKARLNAGEITQEEFSLEDATLASEVQAEKEAVEVLKQEASAAAAGSDAELHKRVREEVRLPSITTTPYFLAYEHEQYRYCLFHKVILSSPPSADGSGDFSIILIPNAYLVGDSYSSMAVMRAGDDGLDYSDEPARGYR
ncbi:uncharacterized protein A4U43_C03F30820 [Asparagus officinalis]|uniref:Uncharacterized protein n=1 Tax=Asparagus officinalis TaxID=4686 RepID=A0A5P1FJ44_ASPOF|nr:uncharacterized protein A4U43_C03F30820 [Asparagus officinalis]